jgi:ribose transport system substrate-binding protein
MLKSRKRIVAAVVPLAVALVFLVVTTTSSATGTTSPFGTGVFPNGKYGESYNPPVAVVKKALISAAALPSDAAGKSVVLAALARITKPVNEAKALACWKNDGCDTGTGGKITVGMADGFCANVWREVTKMEMILQALSYPQVGKIIYTCANLDTQKAISDYRSLISQGADVIVFYADAGDALLPAVREATKRGIPSSTYVGGVIGNPGKDYMMVVGQDLCGLGKQFAAIINKNVKTGQVAFLGGTPGNTLTPRWQNCEKAALAKSIDFVGSADTSWTREGALQATSSFISKYPDLKAMSFEYADGFVGALRAYEAANKPPNIIYTGSTDENSVFCEAKKIANPKFRMWHGSAFNSQIRISLTAGMMQLAGAKIPGTITVKPVLVESKFPSYGCLTSIPSQGSPSAAIPLSLYKKMFKK